MQTLHRWTIVFIAAMAFVALTLLPGDRAQAGGSFQDIAFWEGVYVGTTSSGLPAVVFVDAAGHKATMVVMVLLNGPCTGEVVAVALFDMDIGKDDGDFQGNTSTGGGGGQLLETEIEIKGDDEDLPYIFGSVTGHLPESFDCVGSAVFYALPGGLVFGDVDCGLFGAGGSNGRSREAETAAAQDLGVVTSIDALKTLRFVAGLGSRAPQAEGQGDGDACPPIGEELPNGGKHGDSDCDGDIDAVDALKILRAVVGLDGRVTPLDPTPQPPALPPAPPPGFCPFIGDFWLPYFPDLLPGSRQ